MKKAFVKLKKARKLLELTQPAIADLSGVSQSDVSDMENGKKKFIPDNYIEFLYNEGIDINSIFDDSFNARKRDNIKANDELPDTEKILSPLERTLRSKEETINILKEQCRIARKDLEDCKKNYEQLLAKFLNMK